MRRAPVALTVFAAVLVPLTAGPVRAPKVSPRPHIQVQSERVQIPVEISIAPDPVPVDRLDLAMQLFELTNDARRERGLEPLGWWTAAVRPAAQAQTSRLVAAGKLFHNPGLDKLLYTLRVKTIAENVGMGPTIAALQRAFMKSKGHRENILDPIFSLGAVWVVQDVDGLLFVTVVFGRPLPR